MQETDETAAGVREGPRPGRGPARTTPKPRRGDVFELRLERLDERGRARGPVEHATGKYELALRRGSPGARVRARVVRRRGAQLDARLEAVLAAAPGAVEPACAHFGPCGGCSHQDLAHATQLELKRERIARLLSAHGFEIEPAPCAFAGPVFGYRNKMEHTFGPRWIGPGEPPDLPTTKRDFALGLHPAGLHSKVLDLERCSIQTAEMDAVVRSARRLAREARLDAWNTRTRTGLLRHLVLRRARGPGRGGPDRGGHGGRGPGELMVVLVTSREAPELVRPLAAALVAEHPSITTLVQAVNTRPAQVAVGERELVLHGPGHVTEHVAGLDFRLSPRSFFQTNTAGAEELLRLLGEAAGLAGGERVLDLYCGTGLLGLSLAERAGVVEGLELVEAAVVDARANAAINGVSNARFEAGDVAGALSAARGRPDLVVVDPPRAGLHPSVPPALAELAGRRIVYVSCNPRAALGDVALLRERGFRLSAAQPLDLFPHTPHVECLFTLERA